MDDIIIFLFIIIVDYGDLIWGVVLNNECIVYCVIWIFKYNVNYEVDLYYR